MEGTPQAKSSLWFQGIRFKNRGQKKAYFFRFVFFFFFSKKCLKTLMKSKSDAVCKMCLTPSSRTPVWCGLRP